MANRERLEALFKKQGYTDFKWIDPHDIIVAQWVRMKCMFGCGDYGNIASCPPSVPSVSECREFFSEYKAGVIFRFAKAVEKPEDRFAWTKKVNQGLVKLERKVFLSGYHKAFVMVIDSCTLCDDCSGDRGSCTNPRLSRPTPEALAVDVYSIVRQYGLPVQVLKDYSETMNRYAFLLIE
jgi:predicted metal-binding protein